MNLESILENENVPIEIRNIIREETRKFQNTSEKYESLFTGGPTLNVLIDLYGNIIDCNDRIEDITGIPKEEVIGKNFTKIGVVTEENILHYMELLENILEDSKDKYLNVNVIHKNGTKHYLNLYPSILMKDNTPYAIQVVGTDITEFKNKERELQLWKDCIDSSLTGIGLTDLEGKILYINEAIIKMWGYDREEEIIGRSLPEFWKGDGIYQTMKELREVGGRTGEDTGKKKDGSIFDLKFSAQMIKDETGKPTYIYGSFIDITESKKLEEQKKKFSKRQNEFINQTTHEIKTPLTIIQGFIEFLLKQEGDGKKIEMFNMILRNCRRLEELSDGVGDLYKLERGVFEVFLNELDFQEFLETALEPYFHLYSGQIKFEYETQIPLLINGDPSRLLIVINNVLDNSIKNTSKESRRIHITLKKVVNQLQLEITDNGAGIDPINMDKVFDKFVSIPTIYDVRGTGIGLYLSREVIKLHNGTIIAISEGKGKGTTISINLPLISHS